MFPSGLTAANIALLSNLEMQARVVDILKEHFTGLARARFAPELEITLLICAGVVVQGYTQDARSFHRFPGRDWKTHFSRPSSGNFSTYVIPIRSLAYQKIIIEHGLRSTTSERSTRELSALIASYEKLERATLVQIAWQTAQAFVLVPGSGISAKRVCFLGPRIEEGLLALGQINTWSEPVCNVSIYDCGVVTDASTEIQLSILFEWISNHLLTQYSYLTGTVMVRSVVRNLLILVVQNEWNIREQNNIVSDFTVFESVEDAAAAYQQMLDSIRRQIRAVVGANLLASIEKQALHSLSPFYQDFAREYKLL